MSNRPCRAILPAKITSLGGTYEAAGSYDLAAQQFEQAAAIMEAQGAPEADVLQVRHNLGVIAGRRGILDEAESGTLWASNNRGLTRGHGQRSPSSVTGHGLIRPI